MDALPHLPTELPAGKYAVRRTALLAILALLWSLMGIAQPASFDLLRRAEDEEVSQLAWEITAAYYPQGIEGAGFDEHGQYFRFVRFSGERQLSLSTAWSFSSYKLGITLIDKRTSLSERREYATSEWENSSVSTSFASSCYYEYRLAPGSQLDPRVRVTQAIPVSSSLAISANLVLDPIVLAGVLNLTYREERPCIWSGLALSAALITNQRVRFVASGTFSIPVDVAGIPTSSMSLRSILSLDSKQKWEVSAQVSLLVQAQSTWMGFSLSVQGRGF